MGSVPISLVADLVRSLDLERAIESGTYLGDGTRRLAALFPTVVSIELAPELHSAAAEALADCEHVRLILGDSRNVLNRLVDRGVPTLYFLDGHWSAGVTAGAGDECPLLGELAAIDSGHGDDCIVIDDARLFAAPPPPPHQPEQWPSLMEVWDRLRSSRPEHHLTIADDQILAVPMRAKPIVDRYGMLVRDGNALV